MIVHGRNSLPARLCVLLVAAEPGDGIDGIRNTAATAKQMKGSAERHDPKTHPEGAAAERHEGTRKAPRSEEHTSELQSLMRISYAVFCLKTKIKKDTTHTQPTHTNNTM